MWSSAPQGRPRTLPAFLNERRLTLSLTPHGRLVLGRSEDAPELEAARAERIERAFAGGPGHGLLRLVAAGAGSVLPPLFVYGREFAARFVTALCTRPPAEERLEVQPPPLPADSALEALAAAAPVMPGAEYLTAGVLRAQWA